MRNYFDCEDQPNKCTCSRLVQLDPKGMIPAWVVNLGKKKAGSSFLALKKVAILQLSNQIIPIANPKEEKSNEHDQLAEKKILKKEPRKTVEKVEKKEQKSEREKELEQIVIRLQNSLNGITNEVDKHSDRITSLETVNSVPKEESVGWDFVAFSMVFPLLAYTLMDIARGR